MGWAMMTRMMLEKRQPKQELNRAPLMALRALPCFARAYPSVTVAAAETVPGVPMRMADIEPPKVPAL